MKVQKIRMKFHATKMKFRIKIKVKFYATFKVKFHAAIREISRCDQGEISGHDLMRKRGCFFIF